MATYKSKYFTAAEIDELLKALDDYVIKSHLKDAVTIDEDKNIGVETPNRVLEKDGSSEIHSKNSQSKMARYFGGGRATLKIWQSQSPDEEDTQYNDKVDVPTKNGFNTGKNGEDANTTAYRSTAGNVFAYIGQMFRGFIYKIQIYFNGGSLLIGDSKGFQYDDGNNKVYLKNDGKHEIECLSRKVETKEGTYAYIRNSGIELFSTGTKSDGTVTTSKLNLTDSKATYEGESFTFKGADPKRDTDPSGSSSLVNKKYVDLVNETVKGLVGAVACDEYIHHTAYCDYDDTPEDNAYCIEWFDGVKITDGDRGYVGVTGDKYLIEHTSVGEKTFIIDEELRWGSGKTFTRIYGMKIATHVVDAMGEHSIERQDISQELVYYVSKDIKDIDFDLNGETLYAKKGYYKFSPVGDWSYTWNLGSSYNPNNYTVNIGGSKFSSNPAEQEKASRNIVCWGDSTTAGNGASSWGNWGGSTMWTNIMRQLIKSNGYKEEVLNFGVPGENFDNISVRQGSATLYNVEDIILPASGYVVLGPTAEYMNKLKTSLDGGRKMWFGADTWGWNGFDMWDVSGNYPEDCPYNTINPVYINGIKCYLDLTNSTVRLRRYDAGEKQEVIKAGTPWLVHGATFKQDIPVFFIGANGGFIVNTDGAADAKKTAEKYIGFVDRMIATSGSGQFLVITPYAGLSVGTLGIDNLKVIEKECLTHYGSRYFNCREYFIRYGFEKGGISPTAADEEAITLGKFPPSFLVADGIHMNDKGHEVMGKRMFELMFGLGYLSK